MKKFMLVLILFVMGYSNVYADSTIKLDRRYTINYTEILHKGLTQYIVRGSQAAFIDVSGDCLLKKTQKVIDKFDPTRGNFNVFMKRLKNAFTKKRRLHVGGCGNVASKKVMEAYYSLHGWYVVSNIKVKHGQPKVLPASDTPHSVKRAIVLGIDQAIVELVAHASTVLGVKLTEAHASFLIRMHLQGYKKFVSKLRPVKIFRFDTKDTKKGMVSNRCYTNFNKLKFYTYDVGIGNHSVDLFRAMYIHTKSGYKYIYATDKHDYSILNRICVNISTANRQANSKKRIYKLYTRIRMSNGWRPEKLAKQTKRQKRCARFENGLLDNIEKFKKANRNKDRTTIAYGLVSGLGARTNIRSCQIGKYRFKSPILRTAIKKARIGKKNSRSKRVRVRVR